MRPSFSAKHWLLLILIAALVIRLIGIGHGLPYAYQIDEKYVVNHAVGFGTGDLNPHNFHWPGTLLMYFIFMLYGIFFLIGWILRIFPTPQDFAELFIINPTAFYLIGRIAMAIMGTGTVYLTYLLGKKLYSAKVGLTGAFFLAFSRLMVGVDHMVLPDTMLVFLCVLVLLFCYGIQMQGKRKFYMLAGLGIGLSMATKYSGAALVVPLGMAHLLYFLSLPQKSVSRLLGLNIALACLMIPVGFIIGCPYSVLDFPTFSHDLLWQFQRVHTGSFGMDVQNGYWYYLTVGFPYAFGVALTAFSVLGFVFILWRHSRPDLLIGSFAFCYFIYVGSWDVAIHKYMLPILPVLSVFSAILLWRIVSTIISPKMSIVVLIALSLILIAQPLFDSIRTDWLLVQKDTRTLAKEWIEENIPPDTKIAVDAGNFDLAKFSPPLKDSKESLRRKIEWLHTDMPEIWAESKDSLIMYLEIKMEHADEGYDIRNVVHSTGDEIDEKVSLEQFKREGIEYVVVSSYASQVYEDPVYRQLKTEKADYYSNYYKSLDAQAQMVKQFRPISEEEGPGPVIKIYSLGEK